MLDGLLGAPVPPKPAGGAAVACNEGVGESYDVDAAEKASSMVDEERDEDDRLEEEEREVEDVEEFEKPDELLELDITPRLLV